MARSRYRLDRRSYQGIFNAGFFAQLSRSKFWQSDNDPYYRRKRRRHRWISLLYLVLMLLVIWIGWESFRALQLF